MLRQQASNLVLSAVPWNVFGTLTVSRELGRDALGRRVKDWLCWVARSCNVNFRSNFYYAVRFERGEKGGRLHAHALLRVPNHALGHFLVRPGRVPLAHKRWKLGLTRFRRIEGQDPAIPYFEKPPTTGRGADVYERSKTDSASDILIGEAVMRRAMRQQSAPGGAAALEGQMATLATQKESQRGREESRRSDESGPEVPTVRPVASSN